MKMKFIHIAIVVLLLATLIPSFLGTSSSVESTAAATDTPQPILVRGLVENPLNLTYAQLATFPLLSEVAELQCVGIGVGDPNLSVVYNWTGVPLLCLLGMAKVMSDANLVVFNAADGYSGNITLEEAMDPTTILALEANGTELTQLTGFGSGWSRIVLPGRWGYKWVTLVNDIVVVDGRGTTYNPGLRPNCTTPSTSPPLQTMNVMKTYSTEQAEYSIQVLSNSSVESFSFTSDVRLTFNLSGTEGNCDFFYIKFPQKLLAGPYTVDSNVGPINCVQAFGNQNVFLYMTYSCSDVTFKIEVRGSYTPQILQFLGPYFSSLGAEYYNIEFEGQHIHLISKYL